MRRVIAQTLILIAFPQPAQASPCEDVSVRLSHAQPATKAVRHHDGEIWFAPDGRRAMHRTPSWGWGHLTTDFTIVPDAADDGATTGETYFSEPLGAPVLHIEFEYDRSRRLKREVLKRPETQGEFHISAGARTAGWYSYRRDSDGRLLDLTFYKGTGSELRWFTADNQIGYRVVFRYEKTSGEGGNTRVRDATIVVPGPENGTFVPWDRFAFSYTRDVLSSGESNAGFRFEVTGTPCAGAVERLVVLLLNPHEGPAHPIIWGGRDAPVPTGPR